MATSLPENRDILQNIDNLQSQVNEKSKELSRTGRLISKDVNSILDDMKEIVKEKNEGEHIQKAFKHAAKASGNMSYTEQLARLRDTISPGDITKLQNEAQGDIRSMFTIVKLAFVSPEFRKFINEFFDLFRDILKKQSKEGEQKFKRPQPHHTSNFPTPSEGFTWVEEPDGGISLQFDGKKGIDLSPELEEKLIDRFLNLLQSLQDYPEYHNSISYISHSLSVMGEVVERTTENLESQTQAKTAEDKKSEMHRDKAQSEIKSFVEEWIGDNYSLDEFLSSLETFKDQVKNDKELSSLFSDMNRFFTKSARDKSYLENKDRVRSDARSLVERTRYLLMCKYQREFQKLKRELLFLSSSIQRDNTVDRFRKDVQSLINHMVMDNRGRFTFKPELIGDLQVILQSLFETLQYVPLPPIHRSGEDGEFHLEEIEVNCTDIAPGHVRISAVLDTVDTKSTQFEIEISNIRAHIRNAKFAIDKKTFPQICDTGRMDIDMGGLDGMDIHVVIQPDRVQTGKPVESIFSVKVAECTISKLKLHLKDTNHDLWYSFISPVINIMAKSRIETLVRDQILDTFNQLNQTLVDTANKANEAISDLEID